MLRLVAGIFLCFLRLLERQVRPHNGNACPSFPSCLEYAFFSKPFLADEHLNRGVLPTPYTASFCTLHAPLLTSLYLPLSPPIHPVIDSHACEAGVEHPELESALWASTAAAARALEHTAKAIDYQTLCEGLARLHRVVRSLLREAACSSAQSQAGRQVREARERDWAMVKGQGGGNVRSYSRGTFCPA